MKAPNARPARWLVALVVLPLAGCTGYFSADVRNDTPQPLFAQIIEQHDNGAVLLDSKRLGPGDRGSVGPVQAEIGRAWIVMDTSPNPKGPARATLKPGTNFFKVTQTGDKTGGPIQVEEIIQ
ncbi:MAG: hypothetical protein JNM07_11025 [Phycisphaerae bacterium]|nr:hypothetical protein [Phycisphaerae bacterium]